MIKRILLLFLWISTIQIGFSQIGGLHTYLFLNNSPSARVTALGGNLITVKDYDINQALHNPATTNSTMHQQVAFNNNFYFAGINHGNVNYGHHSEKLKTTFHAALQYMAYGSFEYADEFGNRNGSFKASEYAFVLGAGHQLYDRLSLGVNLKFISSQLESFNSTGISSDWAAFYEISESNFTTTLLFKNVGTQFTQYSEGRNESLPFEIQLGVSKRLKYLPFRISIIGQHLQQWDIRYDDPNTEQTSIFLGGFDDTSSDSNPFVDNLFRHLVFNGEFLLGKKENLRLRLGYNHLRRKELTVEDFRSLAGFSFGLGIKISKFRIDYGYGSYHLAGGVSHFSISTNFSEFKKVR